MLRRGPSKQVACIGWELKDDSFEVGQWFKGRIYERRCDLSPSGKLLAYFAANWKPGPMSWTAVSRTPYLKAVMMWPKGDAWGGGGLFDGESTLALNHHALQRSLAEGQQLLRGFRVEPLGPRPGMGEDDPIDSARRARDGWRLVQEASWQKDDFDGPVSFPVVRGSERIWARTQPRAAKKKLARAVVELEEILHGIGERDGSWYMTEYRLVNHEDEVTISLGRIDWADWDHDGDLLFARTGKLYRLDAAHARKLDTAKARELVDLGKLRFEAKRAPY